MLTAIAYMLLGSIGVFLTLVFTGLSILTYEAIEDEREDRKRREKYEKEKHLRDTPREH